MTNASSVAPPKVREIPAGGNLRPFIDVQWRLNSVDPAWVAPLRMNLRKALDRSSHPFHQHGEVAYFVAERGGTVVGRTAAIVNRLHNEVHDDAIGFFGLFETEDDPEVAHSLVERASAWLADRGMTTMRGPLNFSMNEEVASPGVLVEGFESRPAIMMGHNPPYYPALLEAAGMRRAKDLLAYLLDEPDHPPERGVAIIDRILARSGITVRSLDLRRFRQEVEAVKEVYNAAWSRNWGFVPMTDAEIDHLASEFRPVVDPDLCLIAEVGDEPVGFCLALPDLNQALRYLPDGRMLPLGWARFLWHRRNISGIRVLTLGFKPRFHRAGLGPAMYRRIFDAGVQKGYTTGEASWILADNLEMTRALERSGGRIYRRYRIYEREIGPTG